MKDMYMQNIQYSYCICIGASPMFFGLTKYKKLPFRECFIASLIKVIIFECRTQFAAPLLVPRLGSYS